MKPTIRISRKLYEYIKADLTREHPFAAERIGFIYSTFGNVDKDNLLILLKTYSSVPDEDYVNDFSSGARINSVCIRREMQKILDNGNGTFHVHMHSHSGTPRLSSMDGQEIPRLIQSFSVVGPKAAHGIFLLSENKCWASLWSPDSQNLIYNLRVSVVGFPFELLGEKIND